METINTSILDAETRTLCREYIRAATIAKCQVWTQVRNLERELQAKLGIDELDSLEDTIENLAIGTDDGSDLKTATLDAALDSILNGIGTDEDDE